MTRLSKLPASERAIAEAAIQGIAQGLGAAAAYLPSVIQAVRANDQVAIQAQVEVMVLVGVDKAIRVIEDLDPANQNN